MIYFILFFSLFIPFNIVNALEISNANDINYVESYNKLYLPDNYINSNYIYEHIDGGLRIITNCSNNSCNCYEYYSSDNVFSNSFTCSPSDINISSNNLSSDSKFSSKLSFEWFKDKTIKLLMLIGAFIFVRLLLKERGSINV